MRNPPIGGFRGGARERAIAYLTHPSLNRKNLMPSLKKSLKSAAVGVLFSTSMIGAANATSTYGYSTLHFENFMLTGIVDANGQPLPGVVFNSSVTGTDGANYPGFATAGSSSGGNLFSGTDPVQATSGPGAFPPVNTFKQALTGSSGTRGDAQVTGPIAGGSTSNLVSEGNLTTNGSAGSYSSTSTTINVSFAQASTVNLTFNASSMLTSSVGNLGDSSNAQTSVSFKIFDATAASYVTITDNINGANSTDITPFALNQNVASTNPGSPQTFASSLTSYSYTAVLKSQHNYQITLADSTSVILTSFVPTPVPEPSTVVLMFSGLLAVGLFRRRHSGS